MRLNRMIAGILVSLTVLGVAGCGTEQPEETAGTQPQTAVYEP